MKLPKHYEQIRRGAQKKRFPKNPISDDSLCVRSEWSSAIAQSRELRNDISDYVRRKASDCLAFIPPGCTLVMNNEYAEGEGAAVAMLLKHPDKNWHLTTNDTDGILYALILGISRKRDSNKKFTNEFIVELSYRSNGKGKIKNRQISEYWDINKMITAIENNPSLRHTVSPVLDLVIVYLTAGTDYTNRFFGKTHSNFLQSWLKHCDYIGQLTTEDPATQMKNINMAAVRKLIHSVYVKGKKDPSGIAYSKMRKITEAQDIREQQPTESVILGIIQRIQGTFRYMMSYIDSSYEITDWTRYGFHCDPDKHLIPTLVPESTSHVQVVYGNCHILSEHNYANLKFQKVSDSLQIAFIRVHNTGSPQKSY